MSNSKTLESRVLIRFPDCDPFNHLNNARYLDYFINAREDHLWENYQFNVYHYAKEHGKSWVVGANQIVYLKPAMLMETVVIQSTLRKLREKEILVEMMMWNKDKTQLKAVLWSTFVHFNMQTQRSEAHSKELTDYFSAFEEPFETAITFEERIAQLKAK